MKGAGLVVENSKGEAGPGQHEINFRYADALRTADNHVVYKNGAKEIAHQRGVLDHLHGQARTTPWSAPRATSTAQLWRGEESAFAGETDDFRQFLAGQIACARELAVFLAPTVNSYKRFVAGELGADDARLGPRQPHLRLPGRRPRRRRCASRRASRAPTSTPTSPLRRCSRPGSTGSSTVSSRRRRSKATPTSPTSSASPRR